MRRVPGQKPGSLVEYVPEAFGNRSESEPVRVWLRVPSESDKRAHLCDIASRVEVTAGGAPRMMLSLTDVFARKEVAIRRFVERVEGYVGADAQPILTGADLWERGELPVCNEVDAEIERLLALGGEEKKSSSDSSALSVAESSTGAGSAPSATPTCSGTVTATAPVVPTY